VHPRTGVITGRFVATGTYTVTLYVQDSTGGKYMVESSTIRVEEDDATSSSGASITARKQSAVNAAVGAVLAILAVLIVAAVAIISWRRRTGYRTFRFGSKAINFEAAYQRMVDAGEIMTEAHHSRMLDDPPKEIPRDRIRLVFKLGSGEFGDVWKALLDDSASGGDPEHMVAVKGHHNFVSFEDDGASMEDVIQEALVMAKLGHHRNLVSLVGTMRVFRQ
jgi:PKD repeat protein